VIPDQFNPQSWNRFSYVGNNPIGYSDPSGHRRITEGGPTGPTSPPPPPPPDPGADDQNPQDDLEKDQDKEKTNPEEITEELLAFCAYHVFDPSCAPVLPPETCDLGPFITPPGDTRNHTGCRYVGPTTYTDWNLVDKGDLFFDGLGLLGSAVLVAGTIGIVSFLPAVAFYEATQVAGLNETKK